MSRQWRLGANEAAAALEAFQQRGLFAADTGACADPHFEIEAVPGTRDACTKGAPSSGGRDRRVPRGDRMRIFGADVDVALSSANGDACDGHAFDHHEGIAFHYHAIGEGAAVALVGVADDELAVGARLRHRLPLDTSWKAGAAAPTQSGCRDVSKDLVRRQHQRALQALVAAMGPKVI